MGRLLDGIKASGPSALIVATGLFACMAGPSLAAEPADAVASISRTARRVLAQPMPPQVSVGKRCGSRRARDRARATAGAPRKANPARRRRSPLPARRPSRPVQTIHRRSHRQSRHRWPTPTHNCLPPRPQTVTTEVVPADQLNDLDRALQERTQPAPSLAVVSSDTLDARRVAPTASRAIRGANGEHALIGEIFIGIGALLTVASAARMLI